MTNIAQLAKVLETTEDRVWVRAAGLRLLPVCGRCGGCGRHSFNGSHSICYGCGGKGQRAARHDELPAILADAEACRTDGRLERYMQFLQASRVIKRATDTVMAAWKATGISDAYDWRSAFKSSPTYNVQDEAMAGVNAGMCGAYEVVSKAANALNPIAPAYQDDVIALAAMVGEALDTIKQGEAVMHALKAQWTK
jgi:hypothetical protein